MRHGVDDGTHQLGNVLLHLLKVCNINPILKHLVSLIYE